MSNPDIHAFQGIVTKLRTTKGSPYALEVMAEAADEIERLKAIEDSQTNEVLHELHALHDLRRGADSLGVESVPAQWIMERIEKLEARSRERRSVPR